VIRRLTIGTIFFFLCSITHAQLVRSPERAAMISLRKQRWEKAGSLLYKTLRKDSVNALAKYLFSVYFFTPGNILQNTDSAYFYIRHSWRDFQRTSLKEKERWRRSFRLDSALLTRQWQKIDSAAFATAKILNTEAGYILFLTTHPLAAQRLEALALRDEVAYLHTVKQNTHEAFLEFLQKYPSASQAPEARKKYDRLLYEAKTKDKRLSSFEFFLRTYPETPFRKEIEQHIFELFTLSGEIERFISFIQRYPGSSQVKKAQNILFHLLQEQEDLPWPGVFLTDSLQHILQVQESYLVPFFENGRFGFMDKNGTEIIAPIVQEIDDDYKCGNITTDVLVFSDQILARNGLSVYSNPIDEASDLGTGFLKVRNGGCNSIVHKSGYIVDACAQDATILGNRFLAIQKQQQWYIYALSGRLLLTDAWSEVVLHGNILLLRKETQWYLLTLAELVEAAQQPEFAISNSFDAVTLFPQGLLGVKAHDYEGVLNQELQDIIPFDKQNITNSFFGFIRQDASGYSIYNWAGEQASYFDKVITHEPWVAVKKNQKWHLFETKSLQYESEGYDSLAFEGPFPLTIQQDTLSVYFGNKNWLEFATSVTAHYIPGKDSTSYLAIEGEGKKTIYDRNGRKLFTVEANQIQYAGRGLFIISIKEKKGLLNASGDLILPIEYDAIGDVTNNFVSVLKGIKFGLFQVEQQKLIKPQYSKNLIPYTSRLVAAFRDGYFGFVDWDNKEHTKFEYTEIQYWNDTLAWVKKNQVWMLYDVLAKKVTETNIKQIKIIHDSPDEKLAVVQQANVYGVLSNKLGWIIPLSFTDVVNVGSVDEPLYFTEKHVEEASVYVVIYYDKNGKILRREVYKESDDYEKIYCPDN
jgi:hypothetical protein